MTPSARGARTGLAPVPRAPLPALLGRLPVLLLVPLLVVGSTALLGLVGVTWAAPAAAAEPASGLPVTMTVDAVSPQVLRPGEDLAVTVTITNTGQVSVAQPRVTVLLDRDPFISRSSLDTWREGTPDDDLGLAVLDLDLPAPLQPGETLTVPTVVPAVSVPLRTTATSWGPRGLAVRVVDKADPVRRTIGLARTFALWFPEQEVTATRVSLLAPVVGPAVDPRSPTWVAELERLTRPGGRLAALLAATADHPELGWVVDPRLVEVTSPTDGPAAPPTDEVDGADGDGASDASGADTAPAGPAATAWSRQLLEAMTDRDVRLLPYGDADVVALAHAGARDQLATAIQRAHEVARTTDLPDTASDTIAWPAVPLPDLATAAFVGQGEARALLVGPGELAPSDVLTYTPSGRSTVATASGDVPVLVPDERLSTALATGWVTGTAPATQEGEPEAEGPTGAEPSTRTALTGAVAGQDLLAELAVITRERPGEARHVLLTVPRDWAPDPAVVSAQLAALVAAPWVHPEPVAALLGAPDDGEARGELPARTVDPTEITPGEIGALAGAVADRAAVAEMVEDPALLVAGLEAELLAPLSVAWRADPAGRAQVVAVSGALTQQLRDAVTVEPGPTYNVISRTGELPVRVTNSLDQQVTVTVSLQPSSRRLVADETVTVTVPARGEASALIAVHAISSADVTVGVTLRTPSGVLVDDRARFDVRVRADWEGIGTTVIGALLAIGLVLGLVRSIRRGRSVRRSAPVDVGPDALSPEEAAEQPDAGQRAGEAPDAAPPDAEQPVVGSPAPGADAGRPQDVSVSGRTDDR